MRTIYISIIFLLNSFYCYSQTVDSLVREIEKINILESAIVRHGHRSKNYENFHILSKTADTATLVKLTSHNNLVVASYSGWALVDKEYKFLPSIFKRTLNERRTFDACIGDIEVEENMSNGFYHRVWNNVDDLEGDSLLQILDSLVIYNEKPGWLILSRALNNRIYPKEYNSRIISLALEGGFYEAISYLKEHYQNEYQNEIKESLIEYFKIADFHKVGRDRCYLIISDLLNYQDERINSELLKRLKSTQDWKIEKERIIQILNKHNILTDEFE